MLSLMTADAAAQHGRDLSPPRSPSEYNPVYSFPWTSLTTLSRNVRLWSDADAADTRLKPTITVKDVSDAKQSDSTSNTTMDKSTRKVSDSEMLRQQVASTVEETHRHMRAKTTYRLAHPPPGIGTRQKLHLRPKVYLQLHQASTSSRPRPAFEVVSSSNVSQIAARTLTRTSKGSFKTCADDIAVVSADDYERRKGADDDSGSEDFDGRDVLGLVCVGKKDSGKVSSGTRICTEEQQWEAKSLSSGAYEFTAVDEHGMLLKARWVPRMMPVRNSSLGSSGATMEKKFSFTKISPTSRRHPIVASMNRTNLSILNHYCLPTPSADSPAPTQPPSPTLTPSDGPRPDSFFDPIKTETGNGPIETDESLRKFIIISSIWVAFMEGWSSVFKYSNSTPTGSPSLSTARFSTSNGRPLLSHRTASTPVQTSGRSISSTSEDLRRVMSQANTDDILPTITRPRRSNSNPQAPASAFMQRAKSARGRRIPSIALIDHPLTESEHEHEYAEQASLASVSSAPTPGSSDVLTILQKPSHETASTTPDDTTVTTPAIKSRTSNEMFDHTATANNADESCTNCSADGADTGRSHSCRASLMSVSFAASSSKDVGGSRKRDRLRARLSGLFKK